MDIQLNYLDLYNVAIKELLYESEFHQMKGPLTRRLDKRGKTYGKPSVTKSTSKEWTDIRIMK